MSDLERQRRELAGRGLAGPSKLLSGAVDARLFEREAQGPGSRRRIFDVATTFQAFLWQALSGQAFCQAAVAQVQAACAAEGLALPSGATNAFSAARRRAARWLT